jgi:AcrR family transcriptional regulator
MRLLVTREDYFDAAMTLLAGGGAGKLKIAALCKALNVTTGSFYGYFRSLDRFITEFLAHWERTQTERLGQLSNAPTDPAARVHLLKQLAAQLPHDAEAAIRAWAHTNSQVAEAQKRVDARRQEILTKLLLPGVGSRREATALAVVGVTLLVGLQQWRSPVTKKDYNLVFNEYEKILHARIQGRAAAS